MDPKSTERERITFTLNDKECEVSKGTTVLQAAMESGIRIPALCYHKALSPVEACRLCAVEIRTPSGQPAIRSACVLEAEAGMVVKTESPMVDRARSKALRDLLAMAPQSRYLLQLAAVYDIDIGMPPDGCIRCRLCIRACREIVGAAALTMEKRKGKDTVVPIPGRCIGCGTCVNLCKTGALKMTDRGDTRTISIRDEIIGIHHLERCEACGSYFETRKFLDRVTHRVKEHHPEVKSPHTYCPTCAKLFSDRTRSLSRMKK
jgi:predicted molibdopterin-dependent oxidoreductase YjgC